MIASITLAALLALPQGQCQVKPGKTPSELLVSQGSQKISVNMGSLSEKKVGGLLAVSDSKKDGQWVYDSSGKRIVRALYRGRSLANSKSELIDCNFTY